MAKKFKYDQPLAQMDPDTGLVHTSMAIPNTPQPDGRVPRAPQQSQGPIDLPKARRAVKALSALSQNYFSMGKGKK
jgi:hypothetical protein